MTTGKKRETLKTIAETLNVTHTTVSNVFNRPEKYRLNCERKF